MEFFVKLVKSGCVLLVLAMCVPCVAQIELGDELNMNLNGTLGIGYGGSYGTFGPSSHSMNFSGNGMLQGAYHDPNFLSFTVQPYYNRNQNNSNTQSIFDESGVIASANIFAGSHFPGFVSYGRNFNGSSEYGIPGLNGLITQGSGQSFSVGWSELLPGLPTLSASYTSSGNSSSILGAEGDLHSKTHIFNLTSTYNLAGFDLNGYYTRQNLNLDTPAFIGVDNSATSSLANSSTYGIFASHLLPLSGNFSAAWSRTSYGNESFGGTNEGATNTSDAMATINPTTRLNLIGEVRYTTNLAGALRQDLVSAGGEPILIVGGGNSHSFGTSAFANYNLGHGFLLHGRISHQSQVFNGRSYDLTQYGGTVSYNYTRPLFGLLYFSFGMIDNAQETGNSGLSFTGNVGMQRKFGHWETSADLSYAQNVQTLIAIYTTNSLSYGTYVRRRLNAYTYWSGTYRGTQSGLLQDRTSDNRSNIVSSTLGWYRYTFTGNYSKSHGRTILTSSGLLNPSPVPGLDDDSLVLFDGRSYSVGVGASPLRRMAITFNYASATSDTLSNVRSSLNQTQRYYTRLDYNLRKLVLRAGYTRAYQSISASPVPPATINSYFFGVSRWFNVF